MGEINLRDVAVDDKDFLFGLANDKGCRENSLDQRYISLGEHEEWVKETLRSDVRKIYILENDRGRIGQGRLEAEGDRCRMSYSIIPEQRGCGYGRYLLGHLCLMIEDVFPQCRIAYGEVLRKNVAFQKIFEDLGFFGEDKGSYYLYHKTIPEIKNMDIQDVDDGSVCEGGIMLLSNNRNVFPLYQWMAEREPQVYLYSGRLTEGQVRSIAPSFVVSYNYGYIIPEKIIRSLGGRIINLHISYLPWNRGSDPNFWSFMEDTPKGVTIHQLTPGLDRGDILLQKELHFDEHIETFQTTYDRLNHEIVCLFQEDWDRIKGHMVIPKKQGGKGSYHKKRELARFLKGGSLDLQETIHDFKRKNGLGI